MKEKIIKVIEETLNLNEGTINKNTLIADIPEWDSLGQVMVVGALNEELGIDISIDEAIEMQGVQEIFKKAGV